MTKQFYLEHTRDWPNEDTAFLKKIGGEILPSKLLNKEDEGVGTLFPAISFPYCGSMIIAQNRGFYRGIVGAGMSEPYTVPGSDNDLVIDVEPVEDGAVKAGIIAVLRELNHKQEIVDYSNLLFKLWPEVEAE